jgi:hypothetical protein
MSDSRSSENADLRDQAIKKLKKKREFWNYVGVWIGVNALLNAIWWFNTPDGYYWPFWPAVGMAVALPILWFEAFGPASRQMSEDRIQAEMRKLKDQ